MLSNSLDTNKLYRRREEDKLTLVKKGKEKTRYTLRKNDFYTYQNSCLVFVRKLCEPGKYIYVVVGNFRHFI